MALKTTRYPFKSHILLISTIALSACNNFTLGDFNDKLNPVPGTQTNQLAPRPQPDSRGVITYPNYQVIVAKRNDTMAGLASRVGMTAQDLARHNGLPATYIARRGEVLALPKGVITPTTDMIDDSSIEAMATAAIDRAGPTPIQSGTLQKGPEPIRHVVEQGETAYSIARLYGVSVTALASWNGLDRNLSVRTSQQLLIPVAEDGTVQSAVLAPVDKTPEPPSAKKPLPTAVETATIPESPDLAANRTPAGASGKLLKPVNGKVLRGYSSGNEGLDIAAATGTSVKAAESGEVALVSKSTGQNIIILIRHPDNLYTVYSNVADVSVKKGQKIKRGQTIAKVGKGDPSFVHFEIRRGTESVDPVPYL
ncbi:MAG: peptidoglycan DD-metalloendopeptidase family protein [Proteobacteria bacterium]|nr:peptidoglycan DD-metalloendopeptidase family protein [Pseudomonadota bacterium]